MAAMTLAQARTRVLHYLDDPNNRRWTSAQVDDALRAALAYCQDQYAEAGGRRFVAESSVTSTTSGTVALSSLLPIRVVSVRLQQGAVFARLRPQRRGDGWQADTVARTLVVETVTEFALSATAGDPLVGVGATPANTWPAFDEWVCTHGALLAGVHDNDKRPGLTQMEQRYQQDVMARIDIPRTRAWPEDDPCGLRWSFVPGTSVLTLSRERWF